VASRQRGATPQEKELGEARAKMLSEQMGLFVLRRTKDVNLRYLPPKTEYVVFCPPSPLQIQLYRALLGSRLVRDCLTGHMGSSRHLVVIGALKNLCNSPVITLQSYQQALVEKPPENVYADMGDYFSDGFDDVADTAINGKLHFLAEFLTHLRSDRAKERVLVVSNSTKCLDRIEALCSARGFPFLRLQGSTATSKRLQMVERFNSRRCDDFVFLVSSKAGGVGLNIVGASRLVLFDTDWNPANDCERERLLYSLANPSNPAPNPPLLSASHGAGVAGRADAQGLHLPAAVHRHH
jgi:DNA repair and recombination protein RAD54B